MGESFLKRIFISDETACQAIQPLRYGPRNIPPIAPAGKAEKITTPDWDIAWSKGVFLKKKLGASADIFV